MIEYIQGCLKESQFDKPWLFSKNRKKELNNDTIICFDIETTSAWVDDDGNPVGYDDCRSDDWYNSHEKLAFPYIWMCGINDDIYYARDFDLVVDFFKEVEEKIIGKTICFIHNLSFEFEFFSNILTVDNIFARDTHKPMKVVFREFENIEFRCSYMLTRLSLADWSKQLSIQKKSGDLNYHLLRTPFTPLTDKEKDYCEYDIRCMTEGIKKYREEYVHLKYIPLTQTGEVRLPVKKMMNANGFTKTASACQPKSLSEYDIMKACFRGGDTHANFLHVGEVIEDVKSMDLSSSYPTVMLAEKYPLTPFRKKLYREDDRNMYAYMLYCRFENVKPKSCLHYIPYSRCDDISKNHTKDNGRVMTADYIEMWITDIDLDIINELYKFDFEILESYGSMKKYLPKEFKEFILDLYQKKTSLKSIEGFENIYLKSKQYINSLYGMSVSSLIYQSVIYEDGKWMVDLMTADRKQEELNRRVKSRSKNYLPYTVGIFVTAFARRNLWYSLLKISNDVIYYDTDSCKYIGNHDKVFKQFNKEIVEKLRKSLEHDGIDVDLIHATDSKGNVHTIGLYEYEGTYSEFKTLGAKRYCYRDEEGLHITVSGIPKRAVVALNDDINNFKDEMIFDKSISGKNIASYLDYQPQIKFDDGYITKYQRGICIRPTSYRLSMTDEFLMLCGML